MQKLIWEFDIARHVLMNCLVCMLSKLYFFDSIAMEENVKWLYFERSRIQDIPVTDLDFIC